ncbi:MAG: exodeoxyribonuclease V subunit gamma [Chlamydiota bacterium]
MQTTVILSNQIDSLIDAIAERLFAKITKRKIIVPDTNLRNYLFLRLAEYTRSNIAMGMEVVTLSQLMANHFTTDVELSLNLEYLIEQLRMEPLFAPLERYLKRSKTPLSMFCNQLAHTFLHYAFYGEEHLQEWLNKKGWQQELWKHFDFRFILPEGYEWHLLGFNFLPKFFTDCFKQREATFYLLSPCQEFWEDVCSDKERARLKEKLHLRAQDTLEEYLQDQNPLLANMGKLGRIFLKQFEDVESEERYIPIEGDTLLEKVKRSVLELEPFEKESDDDSIQLYAANSQLQEVEQLYTVLHELMLREGIEPKEIQVITSDINSYAPLIHLVFGRESSSISYSLSGLDLSFESCFAKGFMQLLSLPEHRFDPISIFHLFENPLFAAKFSFSESDLEKIRSWTEKTSVRWGMDSAQRECLLGKKMIEETDLGTWKRSFEQLLKGLAMLDPGLTLVNLSDSQLLGTFLDVMHGLNKDLKPLFDGSHLSIASWHQLLNRLARSYFALKDEDFSLLKKMDQLFQKVKNLQDPVFEFFSIKRVVENLFTASTGSYKTAHLQSVLFSSFPKGSPVPKKVTWILGVQEGGFPRMEKADPLSEILLKAPTKSEKDRYLFLEMIFSAEKYFILSYVFLSSKDHKLQSPSLPVQELFFFVQKSLITLKKFPQLTFLKKDPSPPFLREFYQLTTIKNKDFSDEKIIDVKKLEKCAKHPLKLYFHETLKIYLERSKEKDEEFIIPNFIKAQLRHEAFKRPLEEVLCTSRFQANMPLGSFKGITALKIGEEMEKSRVFSFKEVSSRNFSKNPLVISLKDGRRVCIKGVLENVTEEGFLYYGEKTINDLIKVWPSYLLFLHSSNKDANKDLLLLKAGKRISPPKNDPARLLADYLEYYELCLQFASPLMPECAKALLEGTPDDLDKALKKNDNEWISDEYLEWLRLKDSLPQAEIVFANWQECLRSLFSSFLEWSKNEI